MAPDWGNAHTGETQDGVLGGEAAFFNMGGMRRYGPMQLLQTAAQRTAFGNQADVGPRPNEPAGPVRGQPDGNLCNPRPRASQPRLGSTSPAVPGWHNP